MKNILFINACLRDNSRTLKIAKEVLSNLEGNIKEVDLYQEDIKPLDNDKLNIRDKAFLENDFSDDYFRYAKQFKEADEIVIAAPYWDLSFPSVLKIYLENICINGM
ncbi:MAG: NAD(P)H-dependent oxidoreductase, partial [Bacilli bacterium]|nr:NAD(P)H-dependent oxidoreductase [Bacilli bacterium]